MTGLHSDSCVHPRISNAVGRCGTRRLVFGERMGAVARNIAAKLPEVFVFVPLVRCVSRDMPRMAATDEDRRIRPQFEAVVEPSDMRFVLSLPYECLYWSRASCLIQNSPSCILYSLKTLMMCSRQDLASMFSGDIRHERRRSWPQLPSRLAKACLPSPLSIRSFSGSESLPRNQDKDLTHTAACVSGSGVGSERSEMGCF